MAEHDDLATAFVAATARMHQTNTVEETLHTIAFVARDSMTGIDHVGVTLVHRDGSLETAAQTDEFVGQLDELQYKFGEGPCLSALHDDPEPFTVVEHARHESRWHQFIPAAVALGLRSQLGVRLFVSDKTWGVLNMYSTSSDTIDDDTRQLAEHLATHAALAYGHVRKLTDLQRAMSTREVVGQAVGILMERYSMGSGRAFEYLIRVSSTSETKLRDVAAEVVEQVNQSALAARSSTVAPSAPGPLQTSSENR